MQPARLVWLLVAVKLFRNLEMPSPFAPLRMKETLETAFSNSFCAYFASCTASAVRNPEQNGRANNAPAGPHGQRFQSAFSSAR